MFGTVTHKNPKITMDADDIEEIDNLIEKRNNAILAFADKVVAISSGLLTLTVSFRREITNNSQEKWLLPFSWYGLSIAIVFGIIVHLRAIHIYGKTVRDIIRNINPPQYGDQCFQVFFVITVFGFLCGIDMITAFGVFNF